MALIALVFLTAVFACKPRARSVSQAKAENDQITAPFLSAEEIDQIFQNPAPGIKSTFDESAFMAEHGVLTAEDLGVSETAVLANDVPKVVVKGETREKDLRQYDSEIRDQGTRGTCTVFAVVAALENKANQAKQGRLDLSEEHLWNLKGQTTQWEPTISAAGQNFVVRESDWPYGGVKTGDGAGVARIGAANTLTITSMSQVLAALDRANPVVLAVTTTPSFFQNIRGVISTTGGASTGIHAVHAIAVVGYSMRGGLDGVGGGYLIVKNSWGTVWGDSGYGYLPFNYCSVNTCYTAFEISAAAFADGSSGGVQPPSGGTSVSTGCEGVDPRRVRFGVKVKTTEGGVKVICAVAGSPAEKIVVQTPQGASYGKLEPGDAITAINGTAVSDEQSFSAAVDASGDTMTIVINGQYMGTVQLNAKP